MTLRNLEVDEERIRDFRRKLKIAEFALFGSMLTEDFRPDGDVDVLVSFSPESHWSLWNLVDMQDDLGQIFGRKVDLVEKEAVLRSENYIRKKNVLEHMKIVYAI